MGKGKTNSGGGSNLSKIIISCETGSTVYITDENNNRRDTNESNGKWTFHNVPVGKWTAYATKNDKWSSEEVNITADSQQFVYNVELSYFNATIDVTYPEGSTCTCTLGDRVLTAEDTTGRYVFKVKASGEWTVKCVDGNDSAEQKVNVTADGQSESVTLSYRLYASDFDWTSYGTLGTDYEIVTDDDVEIPQSEWASTKNWKARLLTSNTLIPLNDGEIDMFMVGGGGKGGKGGNGGGGGGGGAGYGSTETSVSISAGISYPIVIGGSASTSSAFGYSAPGGGNGSEGGSSSGGSAGSGSSEGGAGGKAGEDAGKGVDGTVKEFGTGSLYGGGGGGGASYKNTQDESGRTPGSGGTPGGGEGGTAGGWSGDGGSGGAGAANTGGGGGGGGNRWGAGGEGGSGIVVIRNAREVA